MDIKRNILLNPGPATTSNTVKNAQIVPDICPREEEFGQIMEFISKELTNFVGSNEKYTTVLFGGSGTAAVEAIISSVVNNENILIINNGSYGERMCQMAEIYNLNYIDFKCSPIYGIDFIKLEEVIKEYNEGISEEINIYNIKDRITSSRISHIALIHHETTTGILNDIGRVGELCNKYKIDMIVDAMSSFAGIPINMEKMNVKYLASSSNKCIQGMAGVSFVIANKESLEKTKNIKPRNLYLNLYEQYSYFKNTYQMRFTPPVQVLYALKQAIIEAKEETVEKRNERYRSCCKVLLAGLDKIGLKPLIEEEKSSMLLTSIIEPKNDYYSFKSLHDYLYSQGITVYPGKVGIENTFRIANIGEIFPSDIEILIETLEIYFKELYVLS